MLIFWRAVSAVQPSRFAVFGAIKSLRTRIQTLMNEVQRKDQATMHFV